jgi:replicative DNA helicase
VRQVSIAEFPNPPSPAAFERTPPQDVAAEQSVLGGMLLSKDAIADVVEVVRGHDFYRPAHELVFEAILDLYGRGEPADPVTVSAELTKRGDMARVGGAPYLHTLISSVPTAANAGYYARIVRETAILRRLVEAGTRIVQMGYAGDGDADDIVDTAQAEVYNVTDRRTSDDYQPLSAIMEGALDEIEAIGSRGGEMVGVPTGFADLDELTNGLHPGQMIVLAARPAVGKSTLGLDVARAAAIKNHLATCIFSLEMSRNEITMRLLSAEARVPLHHMRTGKLTDDDWTRLARRMGEVSNAPLYIDDSPNMSMMEIRAKCRRLKQRHDLRLVIIDYLQLMSSGKRVESRQQEVSEFSRAIKLLAKELEVPVIAISQLNRGSEQRTDKKPQMSDLRESGCLPASTRVVRADTGAEVSLGELLAADARDVPVWSLDETLRYRARTMTHVFPSGRKEVFRLTLGSGKTVDATANHPFLTYDGWRALGDLAPGSRVAAARHLPAPLGPETQRGDAEARSLGAGSALPDDVAGLPKRQIALLLWHLFRSRGLVSADAQGHGVVALQSDRPELLTTVSRLLLRFGISVQRRGDRLRIVDTDDQRRFLQEIGHPGPDGARMLRRVLEETRARRDRAADTGDAWAEVQRLLHQPEHAPVGAGVPAAAEVVGEDGSVPRGGVLANVARTLAASDLEITATNDVLWDEVVSVEALGEQDVYDATVPGTHNFLADGVAVHNSIEQDADMVVLLHREEMYERESPRAGEADFIVAKHRNGPTATVTVAFQGHYSRFVDMAQS